MSANIAVRIGLRIEPAPLSPQQLWEFPGVVRIAPGKPPRLGCHAMKPFEARSTHPHRRAATMTGQEVDCCPCTERNFGLNLAMMTMNPKLLLRGAQSDHEQIGRYGRNC